MANRVLILSSKEDVHATTVTNYLHKLGCETVFWRFENFVQDSRLDFCLSQTPSQSAFSLNIDGLPVDMRSIHAVWFRRPGPLRSKRFTQPWVSDLIEVEARHGLLGMLYGLPALWVNFPARDKVAVLKIFQLQVAQAAGLDTPETLVTNEPELARSFAEKFQGNVIYKLISELSNFSLPSYEFPHGIPTLPLREGDLKYLEQVRHGPHLFQEKVEKRCDVRVTVVGEKVFAAQIESQAGKGKLDWRSDYSVPMSKVVLPDEIAGKCLNVLRALGLNYGAFDFCLDKNSRYVFLEVNPAGQYLWLEERTQQNISEEIALLLAGKSKALVDYEFAAFGLRRTSTVDD